MAEEMGRVVLIGKTGSGKSTLANMLVSGSLEDCPLAPIGNGVRGTTSTCKTYVGRGWTVIDTMGFGEPQGGTVPDEDARMMVINFLKEVKGRYSHIIFVHEKGRFDMVTTIIWETFRQIFTGGEKNFVVLLTKVDDPSWLDENRADIEKDFPECKQFLYVDFPGVDTEDPDMEELNTGMRQEVLERLEKQMKEMFKANPWVEPDIFKMGDEEKRNAVNNLKIYARPTKTSEFVFVFVVFRLIVLQERIKSRKRTMTKQLSRFGRHLLGSGTNFVISLPSATLVLDDKSRKIFRIRDKMESVGKKVKFYRRQCEYLLQRSLGASKEIHDMFVGSGRNWEQYYLTSLISSLDRLVCCMEAGMELLQLCGDNKEQEVALTPSSPNFFFQICSSAS